MDAFLPSPSPLDLLALMRFSRVPTLWEDIQKDRVSSRAQIPWLENCRIAFCPSREAYDDRIQGANVSSFSMGSAPVHNEPVLCEGCRISDPLANTVVWAMRWVSTGYSTENATHFLHDKTVSSSIAAGGFHAIWNAFLHAHFEPQRP